LTSLDNRKRDEQTDIRTFLNYVAATKKGSRPGLSLIVVALKDLEVTLDMRAARADLCRKLADKAKQMEARHFNLNNRVVALVTAQDQRNMMQAVYDVRMLVTRTIGPRASELGINPADFTKVLHTYRDIQALGQLARDAVMSAEQLRGNVGPPGDFTQEHVDGIAERARQAGPGMFMREFGRSQAIARIKPGLAPKTAGWELFVSLDHLRRQLLSHVTFKPSPELFKALTRELDQIMMAALAESRLVEGHLSINLNVSTMISDEFEDFARYMSHQDETELWVELRLDDVLENLSDYLKAEQFLRRYRVYTMLDQIEVSRVPEIKQADFIMDGYKFVYNPKDPFLEQMGETLYKLSSKHPVVLTRVEKAEGVEAGQTLGVRHFQGYYVDDLLSSGENEFWI
jgi:EAL domain-containing protein (putative c-di-GMP-specific phosphodiesterase class I)